MMNKVCVLVFGTTGSGKSTISNVITKTTRFQEGCYGVSQTRRFQAETVTCDGVELTVVDTIGVFDTSLTGKQILEDLAKACHAVPGGFNQILLVTRGRFTAEECNAYQILCTELFPSNVTRYITIVRSNFPSFMVPERCAEDIKLLRNENGNLQNIISNCNGIIHVDNLPPAVNEDLSLQTRNNSHIKLMVHLRNCRSTIQPIPMATLQQKIANYMTTTERLTYQQQQLQQQQENARREAEKRAQQIEAERKRLEDERRKFQDEQRRAQEEIARKQQSIGLNGFKSFCTICNSVIATFNNGNLNVMGNATIQGLWNVPGGIVCTNHPNNTITIPL